MSLPPLEASPIEWSKMVPPRPLPSHLKSYLVPALPSWFSQDAMRQLGVDRHLLLEQGRVAAAALVQANSALYGPGNSDLPALVVWSEEPALLEDPTELMALARSVFALKGKTSGDLEIGRIAQLVTNEMARPHNEPIPLSLAQNRKAYLSAIMLWRSHLPTGFLCGNLLPLLVLPEKTPCVLVVPGKFWSPALKDRKNRWEMKNKNRAKHMLGTVF